MHALTHTHTRKIHKKNNSYLIFNTLRTDDALPCRKVTLTPLLGLFVGFLFGFEHFLLFSVLRGFHSSIGSVGKKRKGTLR